MEFFVFLCCGLLVAGAIMIGSLARKQEKYESELKRLRIDMECAGRLSISGINQLREDMNEKISDIYKTTTYINDRLRVYNLLVGKVDQLAKETESRDHFIAGIRADISKLYDELEKTQEIHTFVSGIFDNREWGDLIEPEGVTDGIILSGVEDGFQAMCADVIEVIAEHCIRLKETVYRPLKAFEPDISPDSPLEVLSRYCPGESGIKWYNQYMNKTI